MISDDTFINGINEIVQSHRGLGVNKIIGLLLQIAAQIAIRNNVKMNKFLSATKSYYLRIKRMIA